MRVGLRLAGLALIVMRDDLVLDTYELAGRRDSMVGVWLDSSLRALGLKPATAVTLPYTIPSHPVARGSAYSFSGESEAFDELVRWFDAAAEVLEEVREPAIRKGGRTPCGAGRIISTLRRSSRSIRQGPKTARSIGIGMSPGDHYYPQPYFYVSPYPLPKGAALPPLALGHWHTEGFTGAVALAESIVALEDRRAGVSGFVRAAYDAGRAQLGLVEAERPQ